MTPRIGSLFSGAGGLDLAVEHVHWPGVPNLGDITAVDWSAVEPVDVLCGGFPCQDVSAAGRRAGIASGTRSGLWLEYAEAINQLRPQLVVIADDDGPPHPGHTTSDHYLLKSGHQVRVLNDTGDDRVEITTSTTYCLLTYTEAVRVGWSLIVAGIRGWRRRA
ncbi:DNA cytosine methyltransferase [Mycobacteroides abscessus]|nr:DNA cytosine methyltransferase [Mycobacteroides abscessus]MDM2326139.1 DNA cytosine methyltransferase [Mycobacteroides abscessus]MDM2331099.1 DNA cytosine methyltransferase [Mycobacteroides abscessus]MDM2336013.1 DNA cytosine methyltransferase [Mycobacteroides abscessus]MDM2341100.1 DNA cytosine methyltransferase [Mycobacteroides abscessus]